MPRMLGRPRRGGRRRPTGARVRRSAIAAARGRPGRATARARPWPPRRSRASGWGAARRIGAAGAPRPDGPARRARGSAIGWACATDRLPGARAARQRRGGSGSGAGLSPRVAEVREGRSAARLVGARDVRLRGYDDGLLFGGLRSSGSSSSSIWLVVAGPGLDVAIVHRGSPTSVGALLFGGARLGIWTEPGSGTEPDTAKTRSLPRFRHFGHGRRVDRRPRVSFGRLARFGWPSASSAATIPNSGKDSAPTGVQNLHRESAVSRPTIDFGGQPKTRRNR